MDVSSKCLSRTYPAGTRRQVQAPHPSLATSRHWKINPRALHELSLLQHKGRYVVRTLFLRTLDLLIVVGPDFRFFENCHYDWRVEVHLDRFITRVLNVN